MKTIEIYENYVKDGEGLILSFEEQLHRHYYPPTNNPVLWAIKAAIRLMDKYNFHYTYIVNERTGETLVYIHTS